jgi:hypothetical protein
MTGERRSRTDDSTRYGNGGPATGANGVKRGERKERDPDWEPRQGGDQSRPGTDADSKDAPKPP